METKAKEETERIIRMIRTALRLLGFTNREIERRLGYTPSYLTRLFSGQIELRFEHIVDIAGAMGMTAEEFFQFAYPARQAERSEAAIQLDVVLEELRPGKNTEWTRELEEKLTKALQQNIDLALSRVVMEEREPRPETQLRKPRKPAARPTPPRARPTPPRARPSPPRARPTPPRAPLRGLGRSKPE